MKMVYQGVALFLAVVVGVGLSVYLHYNNLNTAHTHGRPRETKTYSYTPSPRSETPRSTRKRQFRSPPRNNSCAICLEDLPEDASCSYDINKCYFCYLLCGHAFHKDCISQWSKSSRTCPVCRKSF